MFATSWPVPGGFRLRVMIEGQTQRPPMRSSRLWKRHKEDISMPKTLNRPKLQSPTLKTAYLPQGVRAEGSIRVGLRTQGLRAVYSSGSGWLKVRSSRFGA